MQLASKRCACPRHRHCSEHPGWPTPAPSCTEPCVAGRPDPQHARYPRPVWFAALREVVGAWWTLLAMALAFGLTCFISRLVAQAVARRAASMWNRDALAQALWSAFLPDHLSAILLQRPWLLASTLLALLAVFLAARWELEDRRRETLTLTLRLLRMTRPVALARGVAGILSHWAGQRSLLVTLLLTSAVTGIVLGLIWLR
jgi:hypothetical protein